MVKATIKTKFGAEITIDSDRETIEYIFLALYRREEEKKRWKEHMIKRRANLGSGTVPKSTADRILNLKSDGFFKEKRSLRDIQKKLDEMGHYKLITSLSPIILRLLRRGELTRYEEEQKLYYIENENEKK